MSFLSDWLKHGGKAPSKLGRFSVVNDMWDVRWFEQMLDEMRTFDAERRALCEVAETGSGLWADIFFAFNKVGPELVDPGEMQARYLINRAVIEQAMELAEFDRLKQWTEGDPVATASACITMRPELEQLYDRTKTAQKRAEELQRLQEELAQAQAEKRDLDALVTEWSASNDPTAEENEAQAADYQQQQQLIDAGIEQLQAQLDGEAEAFELEMDTNGAIIHALLKGAMGKAAEDAENEAAMAQMWGLAPGQLVRMPADARLALAKRMNNERFRRMAELFGPLQRLLNTEQMRRANRIPEEVYDIELGRDLEHVLPSEFGKLVTEGGKRQFYADFTEGRLLQYLLRGTDKVARGGIVCCIDNSGSMEGDRELWAKAIGLCLLNLARKQKRRFTGIHFGSASEIMVFDFNREEDFDIEKVLAFAEYFFNGGTNFVAPMSLALDHVRAEFDGEGASQSDIVFITDGECGVPTKWKDTFLAEMKRIGSTMWGFNIGGRKGDQPLHELCEGKVGTIADVLDSTKDVRKIFAGL